MVANKEYLYWFQTRIQGVYRHSPRERVRESKRAYFDKIPVSVLGRSLVSVTDFSLISDLSPLPFLVAQVESQYFDLWLQFCTSSSSAFPKISSFSWTIEFPGGCWRRCCAWSRLAALLGSPLALSCLQHAELAQPLGFRVFRAKSAAAVLPRWMRVKGDVGHGGVSYRILWKLKPKVEIRHQ
ncbi:uncharacterized protein LOC122044109 [Zingiber officinale]|uniref:uncharacterized protein LOC122044109 n=1 Tax=Zingiber officinale TaxID=94328 RepID=UPI001C4AFA20|nr:uncharacterized protein LOC122044109 [Zingiber officinale]